MTGTLGFYHPPRGTRPNETVQCKYCTQRFRLRDKNGRRNYVGLNAHTVQHVRREQMKHGIGRLI